MREPAFRSPACVPVPLQDTSFQPREGGFRLGLGQRGEGGHGAPLGVAWWVSTRGCPCGSGAAWPWAGVANADYGFSRLYKALFPHVALVLSNHPVTWIVSTYPFYRRGSRGCRVQGTCPRSHSKQASGHLPAPRVALSLCQEETELRSQSQWRPPRGSVAVGGTMDLIPRGGPLDCLQPEKPVYLWWWFPIHPPSTQPWGHSCCPGRAWESLRCP